MKLYVTKVPKAEEHDDSSATPDPFCRLSETPGDGGAVDSKQLNRKETEELFNDLGELLDEIV